MDYQKATQDTIDLFQERINQMHLDRITWSVASNNTMKKSKDNMCAKLIINSAIQRAMYGEDLIFLINEDVFDRLQEHSQIIIIDKLLAQVNYDLEKETLKKSSPDIQEHSGILMKYNFNVLQAVSAEITQIYEKLKEERTQNDGTEATD